MQTDTILYFSDYQADPAPLLFIPKTYTHTEYIAHYYRRYQGAELPAEPALGDGESHPNSVLAYVDKGRWVCKCQWCGTVALLDQDTAAVVCPVCAYYGWVTVTWPENKTDIEAELLKQPGNRLLSPIRDWKPDWELAHLEARTAAANRKAEPGKLLRSLSIGATKDWATGEILSANDLDTYVSSPIDDTAGRNGIVELEDSLRILSGSSGDRYLGLPGGTTLQRPASPIAGAIRWNSGDSALDVYGAAWLQMLTSGAVTFENLNANGDVGVGATKVAPGVHDHSLTLRSDLAAEDLTLTSAAHSGSAGAGDGVFYSYGPYGYSNVASGPSSNPCAVAVTETGTFSNYRRWYTFILQRRYGASGTWVTISTITRNPPDTGDVGGVACMPPFTMMRRGPAHSTAPGCDRLAAPCGQAKAA